MRKFPYPWRLLAAVAAGAAVASAASYAGIQHVELAGSGTISVHWAADTTVQGRIDGLTMSQRRSVQYQPVRPADGAGQPGSVPLSLNHGRNGSPAYGGQVPTTTYAWVSGTAAGKTFTFDNNNSLQLGGTLLDVQVAASHTHVCVTARAALACYNKAGYLVSLGNGISPGVELATQFFADAGISVQTPYEPTLGAIKDGRIIFDQHTKRFYMFFQERGQTPRLLIAASRSEDPTDGWYAFADVTTQYNTPQGTLNGHDYDFIGLNNQYLLASSDMLPCATVNGAWTCSNNQRILVHFIYSLSELSAGHLYNRGSWYDANNFAAPVADQGNDANAYWVARTGNQTAEIWQLNTQGYINTATAALPNASNNNIPSPKALPITEPAGNVLDYGIIGNSYRNVVKQGSFIAAASDDWFTWPGQPTSVYAVRLDIFNIASTVFNNSNTPGVSVLRDRIFGQNSGTDPAGSVFNYGDPGVAIATNDDIGVGDLRDNLATWPELSTSVWFGGQSDISQSAQIFYSSAPLGSIHMSGAASDPSTSNGMYFAQVVGVPNGATCGSNLQCGALIGVAKIDGPTQPDLVVSNMSGPPNAQPLQTVQVSVTVLNQGDGAAPATSGLLYISSNGSGLINPSTDYEPASFAVPALSPGQSVTIPVSFQTPNLSCQCVIGADIVPVPNESSTANNLNPHPDGLHGNIPMTVNPIVNGDFRTGNLFGWTSTGVTGVVPEGGGTFGARLGSVNPTNGDSTISQSFTAPLNDHTLSFDYQNTCPDTVYYDWATAILIDNTTHSNSTTMLVKTCTATPNWTYVGTPVTPGDSYTLTLVNHDDNYPSDPTYTDFTNVAVS
ncbi:MAG TPA: CARDB domain-containing protein [Streptosporangiaceae bacterium]|nr:CARDB domain-containing protein [Streptosporangiaceae bacterium]